jgi:ribosomal protein S18 acetylase RimI-like enzyme
MNVKIRLADAADAVAVAEVHIKSRDKVYEGQIDVEALDRRAAQLRSFYRGDNPERFDRKLWCAELDGGVVGMALTGPPQDYLLPWVGQLYQIHVHPDHLRKGIGTALHQACTTAWREAGITVGVLEVWSNNDPARSFYESHGWRPDGHERPGPKGTTYIRLRRTIL